MAKPLLIGLVGKKGVGKDTTGYYLKDKHGYTRDAFADALRREVVDAQRNSSTPDGCKERFFNLWYTTPMEFSQRVWAKPTDPEMRALLQWYGTEYRREQDPAYWLKQLHIRPAARTVITDVRFQNEGDLIHALGGEVWLVDGVSRNAAGGIENHPSEDIGWALREADLILNNFQSMEDLYEQIDHALKEVPNSKNEQEGLRENSCCPF